MSEVTSNIEMAHKIHEQGSSHYNDGHRRAEWIEILEAALLAIVAVATAWSGYQAARWDGRSASIYSRASQANLRAQEKLTLAGQERLGDITAFDSWLDAQLSGKKELAEFYERRFRLEYRPAFEAWLKLKPFENPDHVIPGPVYMPEYKSSLAAESTALSQEAMNLFENGRSTREVGDRYVKLTVFLATVLLLTAISQRFTIRGPRIAILSVAGIMLAVCTYWLMTFPRI